jgi:hypothetical protein
MDDNRVPGASRKISCELWRIPFGSLCGLFAALDLTEPKFVQCGLGSYLAGVFFIVSLALGNELSVHYGAYSEQASSPFHPFVEGLELKVFALLVGPAIELVLVIDLEILQIVQEEIRLDDPFDNPLTGLVKSLVQVDGPDNGFQCIAKDLAHFQTAIELIEIADLLQPHFNRDIVQLVAVDHFTPHFGQEAFFLVGVFFKEEVGRDRAEDGIAQVFEPFVIFVRTILYRPVGEGRPIQYGLARGKPQHIPKLFSE